MDLSETISPKSDQQNYDDYLAGPRTVTISAVTKGNAEQPVNIELAEYPGRPFKPNKSMRRVLVMAWGADSSVYVGRRMTLFGNPEVVYGGKAVGGIEIAALSHITKPLTAALTATRGRRKPFTVQPLPELVECVAEDISADAFDLDAAIAECGGDESKLRALHAKVQAMKAPQAALDKIRAAVR